MKEVEKLKQYGIDELIGELGQLFNDIKKVMVTIPTSEKTEDARHVALSGMQMTLAPILFSLRCIQYAADNTDREKLGSIFNMSTQQLTYHCDNQIKSVLTVFFHFKIENLFTNILLGLDSSYYGRGFENISSDLFNAITIDNKDDKRKCIKVLSCLRNGFHNNGVHRNADFTATVDGTTFEFKRGEVIISELLIVIKLLKFILTLVADIINTPEVLALPTPIIDLMNTKYILPTDDDFLKNQL